jgi:hypothetical protein
VVIVTKYIWLNNIAFAYPSLIFICYHFYLFVVYYFSIIYIIIFITVPLNSSSMKGQIKVGNTNLDFYSCACTIKMPFLTFDFIARIFSEFVTPKSSTKSYDMQELISWHVITWAMDGGLSYILAVFSIGISLVQSPRITKFRAYLVL